MRDDYTRTPALPIVLNPGRDKKNKSAFANPRRADNE